MKISFQADFLTFLNIKPGKSWKSRQNSQFWGIFVKDDPHEVVSCLVFLRGKVIKNGKRTKIGILFSYKFLKKSSRKPILLKKFKQ